MTTHGNSLAEFKRHTSAVQQQLMAQLPAHQMGWTAPGAQQGVQGVGGWPTEQLPVFQQQQLPGPGPPPPPQLVPGGPEGVVAMEPSPPAAQIRGSRESDEKMDASIS